MRVLPIVLASCSLLGGGCLPIHATAQAGYTQMAIAGDIALSTSGGGISSTSKQGFDSAFGLGDERGSPYARVQLDLGVPVVTLSGFTFEEQGSGNLDTQFGTLLAGTAVDTDLRFTNLKGSLAFEFALGPVAVSPGIAVELFDLDMQVRDTGGFAAENIEVLAPLPMLFLRAEADLLLFGAVAEIGYLDVPRVNDVEGRFLDAELMAEFRPAPLIHVFAGYRALLLDGSGVVDDQDFATDLEITGWVIGGGVRF